MGILLSQFQIIQIYQMEKESNSIMKICSAIRAEKKLHNEDSEIMSQLYKHRMWHF
jgi:hypothetical protein